MDASSRAKATVIVPNWNGQRWLPGCLSGLAAQTFRDFHVIVVDNGSTDGSVEYIETTFPAVEIVRLDRNYGFAVAANAGIRASGSPYVVLLNNDTVPTPSWLAALVTAIELAPPEVGSIASKMISMGEPQRIDDAGDLLSWQGGAYKRGHGSRVSDYDTPDEVFSACAGAALYRRAFLDEVGWFDERFHSYLEDLDVGFRGRLRGYKCRFVPSAAVLHQGQGSRTPRPTYVRLVTRNRLLLFCKNMPARLFLAHGLEFLYGQWYFFIAYRRPLQSLLGYVSFLREIPHVLRERRKNMQSRRVSNRELAAHLLDGLRDPPLRSLMVQRLRRAFG